MNYVFPMNSSEFKIFISVESYGKQTSEIYRNCYVAKNTYFPNYVSKISSLYFTFREITSKSVTVGPDRVGLFKIIHLVLKWS